MDGTEITDLDDVVIDFGPNASPDKALQKGKRPKEKLPKPLTKA